MAATLTGLKSNQIAFVLRRDGSPARYYKNISCEVLRGLTELNGHEKQMQAT